MKKKLAEFLVSKSAATSIEYSLIAVLVAVVIITAVTAVGGSVEDIYSTLKTAVGNASPSEES